MVKLVPWPATSGPRRRGRGPVWPGCEPERQRRDRRVRWEPAREGVWAVGPQRGAVGAGCRAPAGVGDRFGPAAHARPAERRAALACRGPVLVGVGVAPRPIQGRCRARAPGRPRGGAQLLAVTPDLLHDQSPGPWSETTPPTGSSRWRRSRPAARPVSAPVVPGCRGVPQQPACGVSKCAI